MSLPTMRALAAVLCLASGSARAGLQVPELASLPPTPTWPYLWFDGTSPSDLAALEARVTDPRTSGYYAAFKAFVDTRLATIGAADDDTRSKVAVAAALLEVLGATPPSGGAFTRYRDVAVEALEGVGSRQAIDNIVEMFVTPPDAINMLQDSARLQSMAEAYDLLRGSGVASADDVALRALLAQWADALRDDWSLTGEGGLPAHRDTWGIKAGAALVTVALAMPDHPDAESWRAAGMSYLEKSLAVVAGTTGWYGEGVWYLNQALANLVPCAWHVRHATGIDWFPALRPLVTASLAWRQPDGRAPPSEEGLPNTFPWDALASAYPDLAPSMLWAWEHSPKDDAGFESQHIQDVTRFIVADLESVAAEPGAPVTRFLADPANLAALRGTWGADALMATIITARDFSTSEGTTSRHNTRNPLDLVVHGGGALAVPTASGGPQVIASASRTSYLDPRARNIPLIDGAAPFVRSDADVSFGERLDSEDVGPRASHYLDLAETSLVNVYEADAVVDTSVARLVALVDGGYVVVMDTARLDRDHAIDLSWRGRGTRSARAGVLDVQRWSWAGAGDAGPRLDLDVVATSPLATQSYASLYADAWGAEEPIDGVLVGTRATNAAFISVLQVGATPARMVTSIGSASVAAATVTSGTTVDTLLRNPGDTSVSAGGVTTDAAAAFVRTTGGALGPVGAVRVRTLSLASGARLVASTAATLALTPGASGLVAEVSADRPGFDLELDGWPGIDPAVVYQATQGGVFLAVTRDGDRLVVHGVGGGTLVVAPSTCLAGQGADPDGDGYCGSADRCPTLPTTGACTHAPGPAAACDDGDDCTLDDRCQDGACAGDPLPCDDGDPCTADGCTGAGICTHELAVGAACDDGDACTTRDACTADGGCAGVTRDCDDDNTCTTETCDPARGCVITHVDVGAACDDGSICTGGDRCAGSGACVGEPVLACDDGDPCTSDRCDPFFGCVAPPADGLACQDGDRCTTDDRCLDGACTGDALSCDDGNPCSADTCDPALGCRHASVRDGSACDDGNACTSGDVCEAGVCGGLGLDCDDGDPCSVDSCAVGIGCAHAPAEDGTACDDGDACTDGDACRAGSCGGTPAECDDGDPCTRDRCEAELGCVADTVAEGTDCGEGRVCRGGVCAAPSAEEADAVEADAVEAGEVVEAGEDVEAVDDAEVMEDVEVIDEGGDIAEADAAEAADTAVADDAAAEADEQVTADTAPDGAAEIPDVKGEVGPVESAEGTGPERDALGDVRVVATGGHEDGCGLTLGSAWPALLWLAWRGRRRIRCRR